MLCINPIGDCSVPKSATFSQRPQTRNTLAASQTRNISAATINHMTRDLTLFLVLVVHVTSILKPRILIVAILRPRVGTGLVQPNLESGGKLLCVLDVLDLSSDPFGGYPKLLTPIRTKDIH